MEEMNQDVNVESSPTEQEVVNEPATDQQVEVGQQETSVSQEVNQESKTDERGVPIHNVYAEFSRKQAAQDEKINQILAAVQSNQGQGQTQQSSVTDEQLLWCIEDPNATPEAKFYARNEMRKRDEAKQDRKLKEVFTTYQEEQNVRQQRASAFQWFSSNFPDAVVRDSNGNAVGVNSNHPLVLRMNDYMQDPMAAKRGDAMMIAAKNAAFDLGYVANKGLMKKVNQTTAQLKKEQKKTLIAGGGVNPQDSGSTKIDKVVDEYRKNQSPKAFKELIKKRGLIPNE